MLIDLQELDDPYLSPGHCTKCGRFVPNVSLYGGGGPDVVGEYADVTGRCVAHGRVSVTWERA